MKRIVMFEGGVETLTYFSKQMAKRFLELGFQVFFYDLKQEQQSARRLRKFIKTGETVLITFNFQGLEQEAGVYREGVGYVWDEYKITCYNIAADHPYFYHERICNLPKGYRHISIDRFHERYFKEFYPEYAHAGFLPLAGTKLPREAGEEPRPIAERKYDVVFTGNYTKLSFFEPYINWINDEYAQFYRGIIRELIEKPQQTVEEVALRHCEREMGEEPKEMLRIALSKMIFIDLYVRNYWRGAAVRVLVNAGIPVHVIGKGWEELEDVTCPGNLIRHAQTDSETCLRMLADAKLSLNVMPWFKDGAHDRVFNSVLNGAVCVTDESRYLCGQLAEGEGVCYYRLQELAALPQTVKDLLQNEARMQEIVAKGGTKVSDMHTWADRARQLAAWVEQDGADAAGEGKWPGRM